MYARHKILAYQIYHTLRKEHVQLRNATTTTELCHCFITTRFFSDFKPVVLLLNLWKGHYPTMCVHTGVYRYLLYVHVTVHVCILLQVISQIIVVRPLQYLEHR